MLRAPHARPHQDRTPLRSSLTVKIIRPRNVALRVITHHIHALQRARLMVAAAPQYLVPMGRQHPLSKLIRFAVRLANHPPLQLMAVRQSPPDARHGGLERALPETREVEPRTPEQVRVAKVQRRLPVLLPATRG